jgi:sugar lactone lactonase YvrE
MDDLYFLDDRQIRKITAAGIITTVAGNGTGGYSGDGGLATAAQLSVPWGVAVDLAGNLYIADRLNHRIRKVSAAGIITTVAGEGITGDSCIISDPSGVAVDASGNLYISNRGNPQICKVTPSGLISAVAGVAGYLNKGFEGDGGLATRAKISGPEDVAVDSEGNLFIADWQNQRIRKIAQ